MSTQPPPGLHSLPDRSSKAANPSADIGICQWFHYQDAPTVLRTVRLLKEMGVTHLRTGVSWADYHRPAGKDWYAWLFEQLADFDLLLNVWHTPPSISENGACNGPPRDLESLAAFVWELGENFGKYWQTLELWNEPNNRMKWDFAHCDPWWSKFARMVHHASKEAHRQGKRTVLGGMIPVDPHWLTLVDSQGGLEHIDVVAIHGFPHMWWHGPICWEWQRDWHGWDEKVQKIRSLAGERDIWITETGLATWDCHNLQPGRHLLQSTMLLQAAAAPVDRVYWYSMIDLDPLRWAIEGFHVDENEYHLGLVTFDGQRKPAYSTLKNILTEPRKRQLVATTGSDTRTYRIGGMAR